MGCNDLPNMQAGHKMNKPSYLGTPLLSCVFVVTLVIANTLGWMPESKAAEIGQNNTQADKPNIVFILADDFSLNLLRWMRHAENGTEVSGYQSLVDDGTTFSNYFVSNSLCCPSRSTIFTGKYSHNTGVFTNVWSLERNELDGGFRAFNYRQNQLHTFAIALHQAGYTTAMLGKYLNGYFQWESIPYNQAQAWKNWGWDEWDVSGGDGYAEFNYHLNQNGSLVYYGIDEKDYLTDTVSTIAQRFIKNAKRPFFIEIATFAPHDPYRPAYRDETAYPNAQVPRTFLYGFRPDKNAPDWMKDVPVLTQQTIDYMDAQYRLRAQSIRAIDKMISDVRAALKSAGVDKNTYIVFSSDNGFHMGEYSFPPGKMTPFDTDIHVPLVVVGPGVAHQRINHFVQSVDLTPTFTAIGGQSYPTKPDGNSLLPLLKGQKPAAWRKMVLVEHHGVADDPNDPDNDKNERWVVLNPPDYAALRSSKYLYVEYYNNLDCPASSPHCQATATERGYYDLAKDPHEVRNVYATLPQKVKQRLKNKLAQNKICGKPDGQACWQVQQ
jgi:arylsulfatase A-like enzyme